MHERNSELRLTLAYSALLVLVGAILIAAGHPLEGAAILAAGGIPVGGYSIARGIKKQGGTIPLVVPGPGVGRPQRLRHGEQQPAQEPQQRRQP